MMDATHAEILLLQKAGTMLDSNLIDEWIKQGHHLTGAWEKSLHGTVINMPGTTTLRGTMAQYGIFINFGVAPDRIPYGGVKTGATTSKYITGLYNYWLLKGLSEKEALSAAFATARNHKKDGMPSAGSYRFSETGQRTQFIEIVESQTENEINELISDGLDEIIDALYHETPSETI